MERLLWVCLGGAAGSGARYLLTGWVSARTGGGFPWGTLGVNVIGSFLLGAVLHLAATTDTISPTTQVALAVGVLGGFTTYSTFNQELLASLEQGAWILAATILLSSVVGCLVAGFLGQAAVRAWVG